MLPSGPNGVLRWRTYEWHTFVLVIATKVKTFTDPQIPDPAMPAGRYEPSFTTVGVLR